MLTMCLALDSVWRLCAEDEEMANHILVEYNALIRLRIQYFGIVSDGFGCDAKSFNLTKQAYRNTQSTPK